MAIDYYTPKFDALGFSIPKAVQLEALGKLDRVRWGALILAELWDAVHGDLQAIETLYHAAYALRCQDDAASSHGPRYQINVHQRGQLPSRYDVATEVLLQAPPVAQPLLDDDPPDMGNPEATVLRDALRYLTR